VDNLYTLDSEKLQD